MSEFANKLLPRVRITLRVTTEEFDDEIKSYIDTCATDLQNAGILSYYFDASRLDWEVDPQILQAVRWYCLSVFGLYNTDMEKYATAYASLKSTLATQNKYHRDYSKPSTPEEDKQLEEIKEQLKELLLTLEEQDKKIQDNTKSLNNKLDKTTEAYKIYGTAANGQGVFDWSYDANANTIPRRLLTGHMTLPLKPTEAKHATSKGYVDGLVNTVSEKQTALEGRVAELESLTLSYPEITSTDYEAIVPASVGKYALIKSFGGATEKIASKNLIDPSSIVVYNKGGESGDAIPTTIDPNGFITFTAKYEYGIGAVIYIYMPKGEARYYYLIEGDTPSWLYGDGETLEIEFNIPEGEEYGDQWYADEATFTFRIMAFIKEGDTEYGWEVAPEGTVFEPYGSEILHADVEKVESIGANLYNGEPEIALNGDDPNLTIFDSIIKGDVVLSWKYNNTNDGAALAATLFQAIGVDGTVKNIGASANTFKLKDIAQLKLVNWSRIVGNAYDIQINRGTTAAPYKPYRSEPIDTITIPEAVRNLDGYGNGANNKYYNYIEFNDGKVYYHKGCKKLVLNGTEKWGTRWSDESNFTLEVSGIITTTSYTDKFNGICSHYENASHTEIYNKTIAKGIASIVGAVGLTIRDTDVVGVSNWKAYLAEQYANGTPVTIIYALATEEVTDITDLFTEDNSIEVEQGGTLRFVNENELSVPNTIAYVTRKG